MAQIFQTEVTVIARNSDLNSYLVTTKKDEVSLEFGNRTYTLSRAADPDFDYIKIGHILDVLVCSTGEVTQVMRHDVDDTFKALQDGHSKPVKSLHIPRPIPPPSIKRFF